MQLFLGSLTDWITHISANSIIMMIMMIFMVIGGVDYIRGNKLGYGKEFEEGFKTMGTLAMAVAAIIAIAPCLSQWIRPLVTPIAHAIGADPSVVAGILLGADMGGYPMATALAENEAVGKFNGLIVASIMGPTITFTIPVAFSLIKVKDRPFLAAGILAGLVSVPLGCLVGGFAMKLTVYKLSLYALLFNTLPIAVIASLVIVSLWFFPDQVIRSFSAVGTVITGLATGLVVIAVFQQVTGILLPGFCAMAIPDETTGLTGLESGILVCGEIGIVLAGAFPLMKWITSTFGKALGGIGSRFGLKKDDCAGMIGGLANLIPLVTSLEKMGSKGKIVSLAFGIGSFAVFGDFLGFTAGVDQEMLVPMILGKVTAGIAALIIANFMTPKLLEKIESIK